MKTSELLKLLRKNDCQIVRHGAGHDIWKNQTTGNQFSVPRHKTEIKKGTAEKILKEAGLK